MFSEASKLGETKPMRSCKNYCYYDYSYNYYYNNITTCENLYREDMKQVCGTRHDGVENVGDRLDRDRIFPLFKNLNCIKHS